ncbi:MAG: type II toxin-antitoxin system VapC family toxin [Xanthomonadales bacterium]|nr:type II toxin-antitoxin system VapC family toxin [Xanthomonadales bacterium]
MQVLVDTSVWIDHLKKGEPRLVDLLKQNRVLMHPFVMGELACGNLKNRQAIMILLGDLPSAVVASDKEVMGFIEHHSLMGLGIGYVDAHLLAATMLNNSACIWSRDRSLAEQAARLGIGI